MKEVCQRILVLLIGAMVIALLAGCEKAVSESKGLPTLPPPPSIAGEQVPSADSVGRAVGGSYVGCTAANERDETDPDGVGPLIPTYAVKPNCAPYAGAVRVANTAISIIVNTNEGASVDFKEVVLGKGPTDNVLKAEVPKPTPAAATEEFYMYKKGYVYNPKQPSTGGTDLVGGWDEFLWDTTDINTPTLATFVDAGGADWYKISASTVLAGAAAAKKDVTLVAANFDQSTGLDIVNNYMLAWVCMCNPATLTGLKCRDSSKWQCNGGTTSVAQGHWLVEYYTVRESTAVPAPPSPQSSPACTPETDAAFCTRWTKTCGTVTAADNCETPRTVTDCGVARGTSCTTGQTCTDNVCVATPPKSGCTDTDGATITTLGTVTIAGVTYTDYCGDKVTLYEQTCSLEGALVTAKYSCLECFNAVCTK